MSNERFRSVLTLVRLPAVNKRGFTLVELLVVIGIIGVLVGITIPVIGKARTRAVTVQCASNLRQLAAGYRVYADANQSLSVPARMPLIPGTRNLYDLGNGQQYRPRWYELLGSQSRIYAFREPSPADDDDRQIENPVYLCPAEPEWNNARNYTYGYNYQFLGNTREKKPKKFINYPVKITRIAAAKTVLCADAMGTAGGKAKASRTMYQADGSHDLFAWGNHAYTLDPPRLTDKSDYCDHQRREPMHRSAPDPRHARMANFAYCDGHVETQRLQDVGYVVNADESVAATDRLARNNWFSGSGEDEDPPPIN